VYKYTGKPQDTLTGLYYYGARYYDNVVGQFLSRDPRALSLTDPQSADPYPYARDNPERMIDPTGRVWVDAVIGDQRCYWWGCNLLGVVRVGLSEQDQNRVTDGIGVVGLICLVACAFGGPAGIAVGIAIGLVAAAWWVFQHYQAQSKNMYIYFTVVIARVCSWFGCSSWTNYWEIGAWTDKLYDWWAASNYNSNWTYKPIWNSWAKLGATWALGPHNSNWPPGY
jgi:RHS repeat-associated protein